MCGICGIISEDPLTPDDVKRVSQMNAAMVHRGPDGEGEYHDRHVGLGMRRLSIIDLLGGWQPLYNEDRSLALIANGEIYNFIELRAQLERRGHLFGTATDCETILHLYEDHGLDCLDYLRGMFAFALWDSNRQRLMLARDRMGEKPVYLYELKGQLLFASEMRALLRSGVVPFELDPVALDLYFHYQYVPEPMTAIRGVRKLDAGHLLTVNVKPWQVQRDCYWRMEDVPPLIGDPVELIRDELETISELVIRSDVPVGVALSGGLDSSAIAALAVRKYPGIMHAFSVGYPGCPPSDERAEAKALADYLGMPFHDIELATPEMVAFFPELVYWRDDPIADISGYGYYSVMRLAREHNVPVVLQGQGGDELFWGYPWVQQSASASRLKQTAAPWRRGWIAMPEYLKMYGLERWIQFGGVRKVFRSLGGLRGVWEKFQRDRTNPPEQMVFYDLTPDFQAALREARSLYSSQFLENLNSAAPCAIFTFPLPWPSLDVRLTRLICETYLLENGITQGDRLSMASSVELRLPLVDYRLVEITLGLRKVQPDADLAPKTWFKASLKDILPEWVMKRPKRGFAPPVREWHKALFSAYGEQLVNGYLVHSGVLGRERAREMSKGPFPSNAVAPLSFKALALEVWCREMVRATGVACK